MAREINKIDLKKLKLYNVNSIGIFRISKHPKKSALNFALNYYLFINTEI